MRPYIELPAPHVMLMTTVGFIVTVTMVEILLSTASRVNRNALCRMILITQHFVKLLFLYDTFKLIIKTLEFMTSYKFILEYAVYPPRLNN